MNQNNTDKIRFYPMRKLLSEIREHSIISNKIFEFENLRKKFLNIISETIDDRMLIDDFTDLWHESISFQKELLQIIREKSSSIKSAIEVVIKKKVPSKVEVFDLLKNIKDLGKGTDSIIALYHNFDYEGNEIQVQNLKQELLKQKNIL